MIIYHCFLYAIRKKLTKKKISFDYIIQGYKFKGSNKATTWGL